MERDQRRWLPVYLLGIIIPGVIVGIVVGEVLFGGAELAIFVGSVVACLILRRFAVDPIWKRLGLPPINR